MARTLIASNGTAGLPVNAVDPVGIAGDIHYRSDLFEFRGYANGIWKSLTTQGSASSGRYILVDQDNSVATDIRTGLSKYSLEIPFKTIQGAVNYAATGDIVYVRYSTTPYVEDVILDSNSWNGWMETRIALDGVTLNGNISMTTVGNNYNSVWGIGDRPSTINGGILKLTGGAFPLNYFANLVVRDGIYGQYSNDTVIENCKITWVSQLIQFSTGTFKDCTLAYNAGPFDYAFGGIVKYNNCDISCASSLVSHTGAGDIIFENSRYKTTVQLLSSNALGGAFGLRLLFRNSRIAFGAALLPGGGSGANTYIAAFHNCQLISDQPGTASIMSGTGATLHHFELLNTVRNCPTGMTPTIAINDLQAPSITEF